MMSPEQWMAEWRETANRLRKCGHTLQADTIDTMLNEAQGAFDAYLHWMPEEHAVLRSGRTVEFWRGRFPDLESQDLAKRVGRKRYYRRCAISKRANLEAARAAARREAVA